MSQDFFLILEAQLKKMWFGQFIGIPQSGKGDLFIF